MTFDQRNSTDLIVPFVNFKRRYAQYRNELLPAIDEVLASGQYVLGEAVEVFEKNIAEYLGCKYALGVGNGTDALILSLKALGVSHGDEVILPVNSFIATAGAIAAVGAKPVFCDIQSDLNIDPAKIEALITNKTKSIIPVHLTGRPAEMDEILSLAKRYHCAVIEDAAQSIGATYKKKYIGTISDVGCFSLHPLKNLYAYGDGGFVTTNDIAIYERIKLLRNYGLIDRDTAQCWGLNSRLDSVQAAMVNVGLKYLPEWTQRHRVIAEQYRDGLKDVVTLPEEGLNSELVYHNFVIQTEQRDELQSYLLTKGIETKVHYPVLLHQQPAARRLGYKPGDFPCAEKMLEKILSLPIYPELLDSHIEIVIDNINNFLIRKRDS